MALARGYAMARHRLALVYSTRRFGLSLTLCNFVLVFISLLIFLFYLFIYLFISQFCICYYLAWRTER